MAFHAADTRRATSEGAVCKGQLKERCGLEPRTNFFFRLRNRQKLVRIGFENILYIRRNNTQNNTKTQNTQNGKQIYKTRKQT